MGKYASNKEKRQMKKRMQHRLAMLGTVKNKPSEQAVKQMKHKAYGGL